MPKWTSDRQAVAVTQRYTFLDNDRAAANDVAREHTDHEADFEDDSFWKYGSSTTLAVGEYSRPGNSASGNELSSIPASSFPPRTSSLLPYKHTYISNDNKSLKHHPNRILPSGLHPSSTCSTTPAHSYQLGVQVKSNAYNSSSILRETESMPVLFPSLRVKQPSWNSVQAKDTKLRITSFSKCLNSITHDFDTNNGSSPLPQIAIQAPSSRKRLISRHRAPSSSAEHGQSRHQRARGIENTGLPILPRNAEAIWKSEFPGNTDALLTILLTWSHITWTLYHRIPDPKFFAVHTGFPYPVTPPLRKELVSVSFYDTSVEPHKEVWFLGPGDAAEISYHEVDVFSDQGENINSQASARCSSPVGAIKQTLGLSDAEGLQRIRYMSMSQRAKTGDGRWCYVLIKGHASQDGEPPPHLILAWHVSAITAASDCLHTIYPDGPTPKPTAVSQRRLKRFSSLHNFGVALRSPPKFNFQQTLRSASSCSDLPPVDTSEIAQRESTTMHRTVLKLEKAGSIPLIEGYKVDVAVFRGWMDACGKGSGKIIMWREKVDI